MAIENAAARRHRALDCDCFVTRSRTDEMKNQNITGDARSLLAWAPDDTTLGHHIQLSAFLIYQIRYNMMQCAAENTLTHIPQYDVNDCDQVGLRHALSLIHI